MKRSPYGSMVRWSSEYIIFECPVVLEETQDMVEKREQWLLQCEETIQMYKERSQLMETENEQLKKQIRAVEERVQVPEEENVATGMSLCEQREACCIHGVLFDICYHRSRFF